jgi:phosphohistidine phosphatase
MNAAVLRISERTGTGTIMKTIYLLRHAKSSWAESGLSDKQRPLNKRGKHDAPAMGARFAERGEILERVLSSPARRAHRTARLFCEACGYPPDDIVIEPELYFSGSGSIEDLILAQDDRVKGLMLVFHNPDITYFTNSIDDEVRIDNVPTCGLARFVSDIAQWRDWSRENTVFEYFDYPKNLSGDVIRK